MNETILCNNCDFEKLFEDFCLEKDSQRYTNECKQCLGDKGGEWRSSINGRSESYKREKFQQNKKEIIEERKIKCHTNTKCRIIQNLWSRNYKALKGNVISTSTKKNFGFDNEFRRRQIKNHMTPEMNWFNIPIDHVKPIVLLDISKDGELCDAFNWKNKQRLMNFDIRQKVKNLVS